jgi:hypothetical protein
MLRLVTLCTAAAAVIAAAGIAHGRWTGRWTHADAPARAAAALAGVPTTVGEWAGTNEDMPAEQFARTGADGFLVRRYENRLTGDVVTVMLVCGRPGPISVHTPDVCYAGAGYAAAGPPAREGVRPANAGPVDLWTALFRRPGAVGQQTLKVYWGWRASDRGGWSAPENPRWQFARAPALFKLYVIRAVTGDEQSPTDPGHEFLAEFLPALDAALASAADPAN